MTTNAMDAPTATRRLQRPRDGRVVAGVSLGLGRYTNVDPVIFRVVFAVLAVFGGAGFVLYAVGWLLMPEEGSPASHLDDFIARHRRPGRRSWLVVALLTAGAIWAAVAVAHSHPGGVVGAAVLLGVGLLFAREHNRHREATMSAAPAPASPVVDVGTATGADAAAGTDAPTAPTGPAAGSAVSAGYPASAYVAQSYLPPRPRSPLGLLTLAAALIAVGVLTALGVSGAADPQPADVIAVALGVLAIGLLVGSVWGRAWLLIPLSLVLLIALGIARAIPSDVPWTSGYRSWTPTASDVQNRYALGVGDAHLDLTKLDLSAGRDIGVRLGAGRVVVVVPAGTEVDVHAKASAGHLQLLGTDRDGTGLDEHTVLEPPGGSPTGRVTLDLRVGFGDVEVDRVAA